MGRGADAVIVTVGAIPAYDNKWNNAGWEGWLTYQPADHGAARRLRRQRTGRQECSERGKKCGTAAIHESSLRGRVGGLTYVVYYCIGIRYGQRSARYSCPVAWNYLSILTS